MKNISIAIRTIGPNEKLLETIKSINQQTVKPMEILFCIPNGNNTWKYSFEVNQIPIRFVYSEKGMLTQRARGIEESKGDLVLLLDDDIVLSENCLEIMYDVIKKENAQCVVPFNAEAFPQKWYEKIFFAIFLIAVPYRGKGVKYLLSGGYKYPINSPKLYETCLTEGAIGHAILLDKNWAIKNKTTIDRKLQHSDNLYSLRDDGALILMQKKAGGKVLFVNAGKITHLWGSTKMDPRRLFWEYEAGIRNHLIFWREYIYSFQRNLVLRIISRLFVGWYCFGIVVQAAISSLKQKTFVPALGIISGFKKYYSN